MILNPSVCFHPLPIFLSLKSCILLLINSEHHGSLSSPLLVRFLLDVIHGSKKILLQTFYYEDYYVHVEVERLVK